MTDPSIQTFVITGATSGIGLLTAEGLALNGTRLVLIGRDRQKGEAAIDRLKARAPGAEVEIYYADLSSLVAVKQLGAALREKLPRIDGLINNAGALFRRREVTVDGLERTFALNHMSYFVLTEMLRERLVTSAPARIVSVASEAHRGMAVEFDDLQGERGYSGLKAYGRSKLCNILFTRELARRLAGTGVTANCLHPGFVASSFGDNNPGWFGVAIRFAKSIAAISPEKGARTSIYLATSPEAAGNSGLYFDKCKPREPTAAATDDGAARRLWEESAKIAGIGA